MKYINAILFLLLSVHSYGQENGYSNFRNNGIDTSLVSSIVTGSKDNLVKPVFYGTSSGLFEFSIYPNLSDYGWYSQLLFNPVSHLTFTSDTSTLLQAKYDYGMDYTHWFQTDFQRNIGQSKIIINFDRNVSENLYLNTEGESTKFNVGTKIVFGEKYSIDGGYYINKLDRSEYGGITDVEEFKSASSLDLFNVSGKLQSATTNLFSHGAIFNQNLLLFKLRDSLGQNKLTMFFNVHSSISEERMVFEMNESDIDADYFNDVIYDTLQTFDSIGFRKLEIAPEISIQHKRLALNFGYSKKVYDYSVLDRSELYFNSCYSIKNSKLFATGEYGLESFWKDNFKVDFSYFQRFQDIDFLVGARLSSTSPEYSFFSFSSNHYQWNMDIDPVAQTNYYLKINLSKVRTEIKGDISSIKNYLFFDQNSILVQNSNRFMLGTISIQNTIGNKWLRLTSGMGYQKSSSKVVHIPSFYAKNTFEFNFKIRSVPFTLGGTSTFFSKYVGNNFDPALRHFTLSNKVVGGSPIFDVFFAARVGGADLYVKYDNFLYESGGRLLFIGEDQPIAKPLFRVGLNWRLAD